MPILKRLVLSAVALITVACAGPSVGPQFEAGRLHAYDIAKKDAWDFDCYWYPMRIYPAFEARKYTESLENQGKTQTFIKGFYYGYEQTYKVQLDVKCGEP